MVLMASQMALGSILKDSEGKDTGLVIRSAPGYAQASLIVRFPIHGHCRRLIFFLSLIITVVT